MIKELITDITNDSISVSSALRRAKVIGKKIDNREFVDWINLELNGYPLDSVKEEKIPSYRIYRLRDIEAIVTSSYGRNRVPVAGIENSEQIFGFDLMVQQETESIETIEHALERADNHGQGEILKPIPHRLVAVFKENWTYGMDATDRLEMNRVIAISNLRSIVSHIKNRLLDTLIELDEKFPDFEQGFMPTEEESNEIKNIVNYNVFGGSPTTNFGVGKSVHQENIQFENLNSKLHGILKEQGVPDDDIQEAIEIVENSPEEKIPQKLMGWLGKLGQKAVEKGIELNVPVVMEKVGELLEKI